MGIRDWLAIIVIICLVLVIMDGFRRAWLDRKNRIVMKLDKSVPPSSGEDDDVLLKSELPNGGARTKVRGDVPVLMESVDLSEEDFEEYPDPSAHDEDDHFDHDTDEDDWSEDSASYDEDDEAVEEDEDEESWEQSFQDDDAFEEDEPVSGVENIRRVEDPWSATDSEEADDEVADEADTADATDDEVVSAPRASAAATFRKAFMDGRGKREERIEPTFGEDDLSVDDKPAPEMPLENHDLFDVRSESEEELAEDESDAIDQPVEVIVINVMARSGSELEGSRLLPVLLKQGMRLGEMSIFHRHADMDGKGPVMFSMANMIKPGTFSMSEMETFTTPGVSFFMQMPNKLGNMTCFEQMLKTAEAIRNELDAQLKDENRSVFTRQTIEHCRQRVRDFELEMLARK